MKRNHLKDTVSGLAISVLLMTSSPRTVFSPSAAANSPGLGPAAGLATFSQLDLYANIETVGVVVGGSGLPQTAALWVRRSNETGWHLGHPLMRIADGRLVGSLFGLAPATSYNIKVVDGATEITGSITTQPEDLPFTPSAILHVSANAPPGGDGSAAAPFQTIQEAVNHAGPGTQVLVADGIYHEAVTFPASGTAGHWIQLKAEGSAAILDGSQNGSGNIWTPVTGQSHVYFTTIGAAIAYLARDQQRFYNYDGVAGLNNGKGHNQVPMSEGWYFEASTLKLFVRSLDDPAAHSWQIPTLNHAFDAVGRDWLWIEGFEMRFYGTTTLGCGVCTTNASHVVIRNNKIHNLQLGVFINWNGSDSQGNDTRIEYNEISDPPVDEWPWRSIDGSTMEGTAIVVRGHIGAIVRSNQVHSFFNGIYTGSSAALENSALAFDADIYDNYIHHIGDDALEPEGACINNRFRNNLVDTVFVGISLAPVTQGPTWVLRSSYINYFGRGFKWDRASDGIVLVYHNTGWGDTGNINSMDMISAVHNAVLRNNIFQSRGYGVYEVLTGSTGHDWNHDNWYVRRAIPHFKWENVLYNSLADLCTRTGLECQGYENPPGFTNPSAGDFSLLSSSPNIDRGVIIHGINDDFAGNAPDVGAFEYAAGPSISGNVGLSGATLSFTDGTPRTVTADASGNYAFNVSPAWSGTVTPAKAGYTFAPASRPYANVTTDQTGQDYAASSDAPGRAYADFDGNGMTDVAVWRPSNGSWYVRNQFVIPWGAAGDIPLAGDFDGNGTTDLTVWRPSQGNWYVKSPLAVTQWGGAGDVPVPGDYNGDGTTDIAVWRPSEGNWYVKSPLSVTQWGGAGDIPVPGDYNADGTTDIAVWRPSEGKWYIKGQSVTQWGGGAAGDIPVPGDYNGDGTTDVAVWRPSEGKWYVKDQFVTQWGAAGDIPVPGDYDGNGTTDIAAWRPSTGQWLVKDQFNVLWGAGNDWPVPAPDANGDGDPYQ